ncbi:hypothetical protein M514_02590 [Trichuris suis]|uniref:Uncharacterized protein n=1 Tax=Trichuris suis TaxID=68888 RepID=A0A085NNG9_9BILA|nr:hypothetical protein M513_02590 [Trichuris suis]KFD71015.1 hypothetical protein M514_02590 [Trichuris suis]
MVFAQQTSPLYAKQSQFDQDEPIEWRSFARTRQFSRRPRSGAFRQKKMSALAETTNAENVSALRKRRRLQFGAGNRTVKWGHCGTRLPSKTFGVSPICNNAKQGGAAPIDAVRLGAA